eukprot:UN02259
MVVHLILVHVVVHVVVQVQILHQLNLQHKKILKLSILCQEKKDIINSIQSIHKQHIHYGLLLIFGCLIKKHYII